MGTVSWQRLEGALVFVAALELARYLHLLPFLGPWWVWVAVFFAPDLGFLGYLAGPRVGAAIYNLLHLYGGGMAVMGISAFVDTESSVPFAVGLLWVAHVGFDRMLGYGLKESSGFADTHLGRIGRR